MATDQDDRDFVPFKRLFREIRLQTDVGLKLYKMKRTEWDSQFHAVFTELDVLADPVQKHQEALAKRCNKYDFIDVNGTRIKGNGFRSLIYVLQKLMEHLLSSLQKCARDRAGVLYSAADHLSTLTAYTRALQGMELMARHAVYLMDANQPPELMNDGEVAESLMKVACTEDPARDAFYGRCLGFQYSQNLKPILQFLAISMASYEEWHSSTKEDPVKELLNSLWKGGKYLQHPTERGFKIAQVTTNPNIFFAKAFWSLTEREAIKAVVKFVSPSVDVSQDLEVPAKNITIKTLTGEDVTLSPPFSDIGYKPITTSLISHKWREGQPCSSYGRKPNQAPPSKNLIIHFHGGGFVAQSSKSHETYLRGWSRELDCPVLSVDYSLAPEAPFPRALEECVFAYAWALNNLGTLGSTGEKIIFVGDSAGGNFVITTSMKLKRLGLRLPDHIFSYYPVTIVRCCVTPSRFLSVMDPLMPFGIMISCLQAYTGKVPDNELLQRRNDIRKRILQAKGYILPTTKSESQPTTSAQPTWKKVTSIGKTGSSKPKSSSEVRPSRPARPPLPKSTSVESSVTASASNKPKPQRPPPPKSQMTKIKSLDSETVAFSSTVGQVSIDEEQENPSQEKEGEHKTEEEKKEPPAAFSAVSEETSQELEDEQKGNNGKGLTEVDLTRSTVPKQDPSKEEESDTLSPLLSMPPEPSDQTASQSSEPMSHDGTLNPISSVATFFSSQTDDLSNVHLGRKVPSKDEALSEEEIEQLSRELLDTYRDSEATLDPFMSPALAPDDLLKGLPPISIIVCALDPLLDDGIIFAQRLKSVGQPVELTVLEGISHGFLSLTGAENVIQAQHRCNKIMKRVITH